MPDEQSDNIFDLPLGDEESSAPKERTSKKRAAKKLVKRKAKKRTTKKKPTNEPPSDEVDASEIGADDEVRKSNSETYFAEPIDRSALTAHDDESLEDTMPRAEDPVTKAKRERPAVAAWDEFLGGLSRGTMELIYEMGISGLREGARPLVNFRRSNLVKPKGLMLEQHADAIEGELGKLGLTLLPEAGGAIVRPGDRLPNNTVPNETRTIRENRLRNLRSTM